MPEIIPFKGLRYNPDIIKDFADVMAPPYDVISKSMQDELYRKSRYNIVRLILGKDKPGDGRAKNKYTRARRTLDDWIESGVLSREARPCLYIYFQDYKHRAKLMRRTGLLALTKIEEPGESKVLPHERTFSKSKSDRLRLMKRTKANLCSIFSLFFDGSLKVTGMLESEAAASTPLIDVKIDGVRHRLFRIADGEKIKTLQKILGNKKIFIADGHHRYEVSKIYRDLMRKKYGNKKKMSCDYVMMFLSGLNSEGLTVLPTHRIIKNIRMKEGDILERLSSYFDIKKINDPIGVCDRVGRIGTGYAFGMYVNKHAYLLRLNEAKAPEKIIRGDMRGLKKLDVTILHKLILGKLLGGVREPDIMYLRDCAECLEKVDKSQADLAFILRATKVEQVTDIALAGRRMPHKSTYFYPKLLSGLVINKF
jgi:uncharacterized protein (DUF1015 family)